MWQGSYSNKEIKFQHIPEWIELNIQDISDTVHMKQVQRSICFQVFISTAHLVGARTASSTTCLRKYHKDAHERAVWR